LRGRSDFNFSGKDLPPLKNEFPIKEWAMNKIMLAVLKVLERQRGIIGSGELARQLVLHGIDLKERSIRYHLKFMDQFGYTKAFGKRGRRITEKGRAELRSAFVSEKVGFVISRIETLSYLANFDLAGLQGKVILNISLFPEEKIEKALKSLKPVFSSPYIMSDRVCLAGPGQTIGDLIVPENKFGMGTVCSITVNSIFLKAGIPITSKFGGVLEISGGEFTRFTSLIRYTGSSLDPHEIFIKGKMADVSGAVRSGQGAVLASFREIPTVCLEKARALMDEMARKGIGGVMLVGEPNKQLLEIQPDTDKAGLVVMGGLNPVAAAQLSGVATESEPMATLFEYEGLDPFETASEKFQQNNRATAASAA
jgi:repressor of nif and glnA expression